jgi:hypothetical protein
MFGLVNGFCDQKSEQSELNWPIYLVSDLHIFYYQKRGTFKMEANHVTSKILFLLNKSFYHIHNLFKLYILGVFWSALQLYLEHRVGF